MNSVTISLAVYILHHATVMLYLAYCHLQNEMKLMERNKMKICNLQFLFCKSLVFSLLQITDFHFITFHSVSFCKLQ